MPFFKIPYLNTFCWCMRLVTGVRVITGLALVLGEVYIMMGAALLDDNYPTFIIASAVSYYISGGLFSFWFLLLLLFQSMTSTFPRMGVLILTEILMIWLLLLVVVLSLSNQIFFSYTNSRDHEKEQFLLRAGIICTLFGVVMTCYSFWLLKSYINLLEVEDSQSPRVRFMSTLNEEIREHDFSNLRKEYHKWRCSLAHVVHPSHRPSRISIASSSQVTMSSALSTTQFHEDNSVVHGKLTARKESNTMAELSTKPHEEEHSVRNEKLPARKKSETTTTLHTNPPQEENNAKHIKDSESSHQAN